MISRTLSLLTVTSVALFTAVGYADEPILLRYKMQKDDKLIYRKTGKTNKTETVMGQKVKTTIDAMTIDVRTLGKVDAKGNIQFESETKRITMTANIGPLGEYKYDSTSTDNDQASMLGAMFTPVLDTLNGASFKVTISPRGKVFPVKGYEELLAEAAKNSPLKDQYSNEAFRVEFSELLVRLPEKPVKQGDTWSHKSELKLPGVGTVKGTEKLTFAGREKIGGVETIKITGTYEGAIEIDLTRNGAKITGTLTLAEATATIHFDPKAGRVVSKTKTSRMTGTLNIDANGMNIPVENDQKSTIKVELLDKLPN